MNDGFRVTIDRRGGSFYWEFNLLGERYSAPRGEPTIIHAAEAADSYRRRIAATGNCLPSLMTPHDATAKARTSPGFSFPNAVSLPLKNDSIGRPLVR